IGVSGGEMGARTGPSIMPGGDEVAWKQVKPILEAVSAKVDGQPCVAYMGKVAAGHYVKMVHNGIEYAIMQLISEIYDLAKRGAGLTNDELHVLFKKWTSQDAMYLPVSIPTIDMAVAMRDLSVYKNERMIASSLYKPKLKLITK